MREDMRTAWTKTVYETKARSVMGTVGGFAQQKVAAAQQKLHGVPAALEYCD